MHLEARKNLTVHWPGGERRFASGERIHTENSYKYAAPDFDDLLRAAGFRPATCWMDPQRTFAVFAARA
jgi:uncharacterized SAM-dependent methyltransferase